MFLGRHLLILLLGLMVFAACCPVGVTSSDENFATSTAEEFNEQLEDGECEGKLEFGLVHTLEIAPAQDVAYSAHLAEEGEFFHEHHLEHLSRGPPPAAV